jgi:hypothetical protein
MRYALCWIVAISALDAWYCVSDGHAMYSIELNPLVTRLLDIGGMPLLVSAKVAGTGALVVVVGEMRDRLYRFTGIVVTVLCMVQSLVLLSYIPRWF